MWSVCSPIAPSACVLLGATESYALEVPCEESIACIYYAKDFCYTTLDDWGLKDNVKAHFVIPPHLDPIRADESRVRQVLRNLVGNAVKFTDEGSITVRVDAEGSTVRRIHVEDTGVGVPPDRIKTIFMAFEQGDGAKTRAQQGSGLGLAISNALCEMMGMQLSVESVLGEGSTFTVTLGG